MTRHVVDVLVGVGEDYPLPFAERRHVRARRSTHDEFERRVQLTHGLSRLRRDLSVVFSRGVAQLPRTVHLVAKTPHLDAERVTLAVGDPTLGERGARSNIAVFKKVEGILNSAGAEVYGEHKFAADLVQPRRELMQTDCVGLR